MMCYRDMTFCPFHLGCAKGSTCPRAYTDAVKSGAREWMGDDAPVCLYAERPDCWRTCRHDCDVDALGRCYSDADSGL